MPFNIEFDVPAGFFCNPYPRGPSFKLSTNPGKWFAYPTITTHAAPSAGASNSVSLHTFAARVYANNWHYLKYLNPLHYEQELYLLYDDYDIRRYGAWNLLDATNDMIKRVHNVEAQGLLHAAIPAIEQWVAGTLLQRPGRAVVLRAWDQYTRGDILKCFTSVDFADMASVERWYAPAFRHVLWNYHMKLQRSHFFTERFAGKQALLFHRFTLDAENGLMMGGIDNSIPLSPPPHSESKIINGVLVVDGSTATATRMAAWASDQEQKEEKNRNRRKFAPIHMIPSPLSVQLGVSRQDLKPSTVSRIIGADPAYLIRRPSDQQPLGTPLHTHSDSRAAPPTQQLESKEDSTPSFNSHQPRADSRPEWQHSRSKQPLEFSPDRPHQNTTTTKPAFRAPGPKHCWTPPSLHSSSAPATVNPNWRAHNQWRPEQQYRRKQGGWRHHRSRRYAEDWQEIAK